VDVQFMQELSQLVPVVPVLAKADTMTSEELKVSHSGLVPRWHGGCGGLHLSVVPSVCGHGGHCDQPRGF
jgi:hypothetical protein